MFVNAVLFLSLNTDGTDKADALCQPMRRCSCPWTQMERIRRMLHVRRCGDVLVLEHGMERIRRMLCFRCPQGIGLFCPVPKTECGCVLFRPLSFCAFTVRWHLGFCDLPYGLSACFSLSVCISCRKMPYFLPVFRCFGIKNGAIIVNLRD